MALPERTIEAKGHPQRDFTVNQNEVRLQMRAMVDPMCDAIEQTADAIIAGTTNRTMQQAVLRWKIEGAPALRKALFRPDPFTAMSETWVLFYQMADYFETGRGQAALGPASARRTIRSRLWCNRPRTPAVVVCRWPTDRRRHIRTRGGTPLRTDRERTCLS
jgi:hypothetical protein